MLMIIFSAKFYVPYSICLLVVVVKHKYIDFVRQPCCCVTFCNMWSCPDVLWSYTAHN